MRLVRAQKEAERLRGILWSNGMNPAAGSTEFACGKKSRRRNSNVTRRTENGHHPQRLAPLGAFGSGVSVREDRAVPPLDPRNPNNSVRHRVVGGNAKRAKGEACVILQKYCGGGDQNDRLNVRSITLGSAANHGSIIRSMPVDGPGSVESQRSSGLYGGGLVSRSDGQGLLGFGHDTASDELVTRYSGPRVAKAGG